MKEEIIEKILRKMKETVSENNYKLALAITGRRPGKIRDVLMSSKDGETLLEYIENLQSQLKAKEEVVTKLKEWLEETLNELKQNDVYDRTSYEMGQVIATECIIAKIEDLEILSKGENK